jgi:hypothetical protein
LIDDDSRVTFELFLFTINIKKEVCGVFELFLFLKRRYEKEKIPQHVMINVKTQISLHQSIASMIRTYCD